VAINEAHGPDHPDVAITLGTLGALQLELGDLAHARTTVERVLATFQATNDHPNIGKTLGTLGRIQLELRCPEPSGQPIH
jgi:hypothetical protein